jgi:hypothetical protein
MISELQQKAGVAADGHEHDGGLDVVVSRLEGCRLQRRHALAPLRRRRILSSGFSDFDASRDRVTCSVLTVIKGGKFDMEI